MRIKFYNNFGYNFNLVGLTLVIANMYLCILGLSNILYWTQHKRLLWIFQRYRIMHQQ